MTRSLKVLRLSLAVSILAVASVAAAANNSEQVVFSGTGVGTFTPSGGHPTASPFGFWIWCESSSGNPYLGQCSGAMYFYALGIVKGVEDGSITELSDGIYQISVIDRATGGSVVNCMLTNEPPLKSGPRNTVDVSCTAPFGSGQATSSVVNVTGP
jgi:hypothetical protein